MLNAARPISFWIAFAAAGAACVAAGQLLTGVARLGPLSSHMAGHIVLMNVLAPIVALLSVFNIGRESTRSLSPGALPIAAVVQIAALWASHSPAALKVSADFAAVHLFVQAALFVISLWFWTAVFAQRGAMRWRALLILLLTGKLFCMLGVLLVFAPRSLYHSIAAGHGHAAAASELADQQLAGLLMVAACPASYVLAAIVIASKWLSEVAANNGASGKPSFPEQMV